MEYIKFSDEYKNDYVMLIKLLWPDIENSEILSIIDEHKNNGNKIFIAVDNDQVVGFLNSSIRSDYVEGSSTSKTGYIEGIYVLEPYRKKYIARNLLETVFQFFRSLKIFEVGSDVELDNEISAIFHESVGFIESSRNIHYIIKLDE